MITKENYEEFFLLYIDNELPPAARAAVEKFVEENPQLQEEWEALLQCRVDADRSSVFSDKEILLREDLLSYVDGELSEERRAAVEAFVHQYPSKAVELQQLLITVSKPDLSVGFPDKESLYRTEKHRRVLLMPWMQAGIAAAVLGLVALLLLTVRHDGRPAPAVVKIMPDKKINKNQPATVTPAIPAPLYSQGNDDHTGEKATARNNLAQRKQREKIIEPVPPAKEKPDVATRPLEAALVTAKTSDNRNSETTAPVEITPDAGQTTLVKSTVADVNIPKEQSSFATQALMQEAGAGDTKESLTAAPAGKNKLRGIFRRVSRTFGKTADRNNDGQKEVLISAFQVALK